MRRWIVAALMLGASPALAQGWANSSDQIIPSSPPNQRPPDARDTDGRAVAAPAVVALITAAKARPRGVLLETDAARLGEILMQDRALDETEIDLLDELSTRRIRAITVSPASGKGPSEVTGTVSGATLRVFEAIFEQRYRASWEARDPVAGWRQILAEARRSDGSHSRVRAFLAGMARKAASDSTPANTYEPARKLISDISARNEKLPLPDRTYGRRLAWEAFVDADIHVQGRLPDFVYSWLRQPPK